MSALNGVPTEHLWMAELLDGKHFPLRFVGYGPDGVKETGSRRGDEDRQEDAAGDRLRGSADLRRDRLDQMLRRLRARMGG